MQTIVDILTIINTLVLGAFFYATIIEPKEERELDFNEYVDYLIKEGHATKTHPKTVTRKGSPKKASRPSVKKQPKS
jgi:hypothetical protein